MIQTSKFRFAIIFIVILIGTGVFLSMRNTSPNLLKKSTHLTDSIGYEPYFWLTNEELLYLAPNQMVGTYALHRLKVASGADETQGNIKTGNFRLSPDGQWALTITPSNSGSLFTLERTDGKRQFRFFTELEKGANIEWSRDNKALIALTYSDSGGFLTIFPLDKLAVLPAVPIALSDNQILLGVTYSNRGLAIQNIFDTQLTRLHDNITLYDFPLAGTIDVHKIEVPRPVGGSSNLNAIVLSPSGNRIAWLFTAHHQPALYSALKSLYNVFGINDNTINDHTSVSLWTSKLDGSDMRELGSSNLKSGDLILNFLRWTPDGQRLSYMYNGKLCSISATP